MEQNIGKFDKVVRGILALVFFYLGYANNYWFYLIAVAITYTIATGFCWPYKLLGIHTCPVKLK